MKSVVVTRTHSATYADPISFVKGERVEVGKADTEFPNWYWCRNGSGKEGWVHASLLVATTRQTVAACNYNAQELTVAAGQEATVLKQLDGWLYVRLGGGDEGWIPESCVRSAPT
jgi:SH3-like domain-containing protein